MIREHTIKDTPKCTTRDANKFTPERICLVTWVYPGQRESSRGP